MTISLPTFPMAHRPRAFARFLLSGLLLTLSLLPAGCAGPDYQKLFTESLAKEALTCMHPRGVFQSADDFKEEGDGVYAGTIYWKARPWRTSTRPEFGSRWRKESPRST